MCLAIPGKVLEVEGNTAKVDFGYGTTRNVDITLVDVEVGQYVLVHVGYAIQVLDKEVAEETLKLWREILASPVGSMDGPACGVTPGDWGGVAPLRSPHAQSASTLTRINAPRTAVWDRVRTVLPI